MPNGNINSPYFGFDDELSGINSTYDEGFDWEGLFPQVKSPTNEIMDEEYEPTSEQQATGGGGMFSEFLGPGVNIYDPQSIATGLMGKYNIEGLTPGMFPPMSKDLMAASQASTYDAYKRLLTTPETRKYEKMISSSAGLLNPNKKRQRAMRAYKAGLGDIKSNIYDKTSMAREGIRNWLTSALEKVKRMTY